VDRGVDRGTPSAACAFMASTRGIAAAQARAAIERASFNPLVQGSPPGAPPAVLIVFRVDSWTDENRSFAACRLSPSGYMKQLPSGSWRAKVYAGKDQLTGREIRQKCGELACAGKPFTSTATSPT
jgi:hypothetical protein